MSKTYELNSPFIDLEWEGNTPYFGVIVVVWMLFWACVMLGMVYLYAIELPKYIGFEATLLAGVGLIAVGMSADS